MNRKGNWSRFLSLQFCCAELAWKVAIAIAIAIARVNLLTADHEEPETILEGKAITTSLIENKLTAFDE